jgi:hypothetical protein
MQEISKAIPDKIMDFMAVYLLSSLVAVLMCLLCSAFIGAYHRYLNQNRKSLISVLVVTFVLGLLCFIYLHVSFFFFCSLFCLYYVNYVKDAVREPVYTLLWSIAILFLIVLVTQIAAAMLLEQKRLFDSDFIFSLMCLVATIIAHRISKFIYPEWVQESWKVRVNQS